MAYKAYVGYSSVGASGIDVHTPIIDVTNDVVYDDAHITLIPGVDLVTYTTAEFQAAVQTALLAYSVVQSYGLTANDIIWVETAESLVPRTFSSPSRSLNSAFQISTIKDALVSYSVDISCTINLTSGQNGTTFLEYADDSGFTTNVKEVCRTVNANTGSLTLGLNLTQISTSTLSGMIPAGKYARLRTANTTGSPTFTYRSGQEVLL